MVRRSVTAAPAAPAAILAGLAWLLFAPAAAAAVTCRIDGASDMDFGTLTLPVGGQSTTATVTASCVGTATGDVGRTALVCAGAYPNGTPRPMARTTAPAATLNHDLYRDPAHTQQVNFAVNAATTITITARNVRVSRPITLYGRLATAQPNPTPGSYSEAITGVWGFSIAAGADCLTVPQASPDYTFTARATLLGSCAIAAAPLAFGSHAGLPAAVDASTSLTVACTNGTPYTVRLNGGQSGSIAARRLYRGGTGPQTIAYNLYTNAARTQLWGDGVGGATVTGAGTGAGQGTPQVLTVYGRVPAAAAPVAGTYTDVVTATVEF